MRRHAVTKHLHILEKVGIVRSIRVGCENQFVFEPKPIDDVREYLEHVSKQWDSALASLKSFVED